MAKVKDYSTIRKAIARLSHSNHPERDLFYDDPLAARIAYEVVVALRWTTEDVKGWPKIEDSIKSAANLIRLEINRGQIRLTGK